MQFNIVYGVLKKAIGNDRVVAIPEGVTKIESCAFGVRTAYDDLILPSTLRVIEVGGIYEDGSAGHIGRIIFREGCEKLMNCAVNVVAREIYLPASLRFIGTGNFSRQYEESALRAVKFADPYGWQHAGSSGNYKPLPFSLGNAFDNADYFTGRRNPPGVYGLSFYTLKK